MHTGAPAGPAAFVVPFWSDGAPDRLRYLREALDSVWAQSDPEVVAIVVDDGSPSQRDVRELLRWAGRERRLLVELAPDNRGPGRCRNLGVRRAHALGAPFVCFLDADDISHPDRARTVRAVLATDPAADVVYAGFRVIDEDGRLVPREQLVGGIRLLMEEIAQRPLAGYDCWITLAVERDNLTIPSALNVRTALALAVPFPDTHRFHEDTHTWLRYSASGAKVVHAADIPSSYRVPHPAKGSASRERAGGTEAFNLLRAETVGEGLAEATRLGIRRGVVGPREALTIRTRYLLSVAGMLLQEGSVDVARDLVDQARRLSPVDFEAYRASYPLAGIDRPAGA
jgi:hypothetical protein